MSSYPKLNHENLDAYQAAIEFLALVARLLERFPRGYGPMADQLRRAALSIPLNIAEGYGKRGIDDRARFYDIARGSTHECGAILDASRVLQIVDEATYVQGKTLLHRIVSMLVIEPGIQKLQQTGVLCEPPEK
jgi:four helix bundle protein